MASFGIETHYRGYRFRSRAEARWAAFFDLLGWRWDYEPLDLKGYVPDFIVHVNRDVLFEVKGGAIWLDTCREEGTKIAASGWEGEFVIVPAAPDFSERRSFAGCIIGLMNDRYSFEGAGVAEPQLSDARLFLCEGCGEPSFHNTNFSYACRRSGCHDGDHLIGNAWLDEALMRWAAACDATGDR